MRSPDRLRGSQVGKIKSIKIKSFHNYKTDSSNHPEDLCQLYKSLKVPYESSPLRTKRTSNEKYNSMLIESNRSNKR